MHQSSEVPGSDFAASKNFLAGLRRLGKLLSGMNKRSLGVLLSLIMLGSVQGADTEKPSQPQAGQPAPEFSLQTGEGSSASLKDFKGKWVVLYFYPKDFTSGCTVEAHNFQRDLAKYQEAGAVILGVSVDTAQSHKEFCAKEGLNFKLLADPELTTVTKYGSVMEHNGTKMAARNTFLINPDGKIAKVYTGVNPTTHSEEVLKDLSTLKKS